MYFEDVEKSKVKQILDSFERNMDSLVGMPSNDTTRDIAQCFVKQHVQEMEATGYRMKDRYTIPSVSISGGYIYCVPIEFEREIFPRIVVTASI